MPRIFDNIEKQLIGALRETLNVSGRAILFQRYISLCGRRVTESS
jgi:hypothetical protein